MVCLWERVVGVHARTRVCMCDCICARARVCVCVLVRMLEDSSYLYTTLPSAFHLSCHCLAHVHTCFHVQPHEPGLQPHEPGLQSDQSGVQPYEPGLQPHQPGIQSDQPGLQVCIGGAPLLSHAGFFFEWM